MQFSKQVVPFLSIMTMIEGRKDDDLLLKKGGQGFPHIAVMDSEGGVIAVANEWTVAGFEKALKGDAQRYLDLRAKAKAGDAVAQVDFALLEGELGLITFAELSKRLEGKTLKDAQKATFGDLEIGAWIAALEEAQDEASAKAVAKKIADAFAGGRMPTRPDLKQPFLGVSLGYSLQEEEPDLAQKAFDALRPLYEEAYGKDPRVQQWIRETSDKIAQIRDAKGPPAKDEGIEEGGGDK